MREPKQPVHVGSPSAAASLGADPGVKHQHRILGANFERQVRYLRDETAQRLPSGLVPVTHVANLAAETAGFEVRDVENLREHYARTLRRWVTRLESNREQAIAAANEVSYRTWKLYMAVACYAFETGIISVNQSLLSKPVGGKTSLPPTRADIYAP